MTRSPTSRPGWRCVLPPGEVPFGFDGLLGGLYRSWASLRRPSNWFQSHMDPVRDPLATIRANRVLVLSMVGYAEESMVEATDIVKAAETTGNPYALTYALLAYGYAFRGTDTQASTGGNAARTDHRARKRQPLKRVFPGIECRPPRGSPR